MSSSLKTILFASSIVSTAFADTNSSLDLSLFLPNIIPDISFPQTSSTNANTVSACAQISALSGFETQSLPLGALNLDYEQAKLHYWSAANAELTPECVTFPTEAQHISDIIAIINQYEDVKFATKGGGHNSNLGFSCVDGGVLIALSKMANTTLSDDQKVAFVGPGSRWENVVDTLEPFGLATVGGRLGDVGVGGYNLGGGLSFLSAEEGLACDTIVNYQVILANASIVDVNKTSNPDLFWALKGGGNQFGIVARYDMQTIPVGNVWGGTKVYSAEYAEALINATQHFTENFNDPKAAVIVTAEIAIETLLEIFVVFYFYNGEEPPAGIFDMFNEIPVLLDETKVQTYADVLNANDMWNIYGARYLIRGTTLPLLPAPNGTDLFLHHYTTWKSYITTIALPHLDFVFTMAYQPMPFAIPLATQASYSGSNALSMSPDSGSHMWMEYNILWETSSNDDLIHEIADNITTSIDEYAKTTYRGVRSVGFVERDGLTEDQIEFEQYNPIFMNDAMFDQLPLQSYGDESYERLKEINVRYDPTGFWARQTGGFKFS